MAQLLKGSRIFLLSLNGLLWLLQFDQSNLNDDMAQAAQAAGVQFIPIPLEPAGSRAVHRRPLARAGEPGQRGEEYVV